LQSGGVERRSFRSGSGTATARQKIKKTLHQRTDTRAIAKSLACVCKRTLLRVINTLLDQVLGDSRRGFLCALNAAFGCCAGQSVYNSAGSRLAKNLDELDGQEFKCADGSAQQGGSGAFFLSSALSTSAFRSLTSTSADSEGGGRKLPAGDKSRQTESTEGAEGFAESTANRFFHTHVGLRFETVGNAADTFTHWGFILFWQGCRAAEQSGFEHADGTTGDTFTDFTYVVADALTLAGLDGRTETSRILSLEVRLPLPQDTVNAGLFIDSRRIAFDLEPVAAATDRPRDNDFGHATPRQ
jgi:hypothetical protein